MRALGRIHSRMCAALLGCLAMGTLSAQDDASGWPKLLREPSGSQFGNGMIDPQQAWERERLLIAPRRVHGQRGHASLEIEASSALGWLCRPEAGLSVTLGSLDADCLQWQLGAEDPLKALTAGTLAEANLAWVLPDADWQLGASLSWLMPGTFSAVPLPHEQTSWLAPLLPFEQQAHDSRALGLSLQLAHRLDQRSWLRLSGAHRSLQTRYPFAATPLRDWSQSALSFDAGIGAFSGTVRGHRNQSAFWPRAWTDLDLGISWHTPWAGRITLGARNVLGHAPETPVLPDVAEPESRTPYVRYQQDL